MTDALYIRLVAPDGSPIYPEAAYTVNARGFPCWSEWRPEGDGVYAIRRSTAEPFGLIVLWEVPGFGQVMVRADAEGAGYRTGAPGVLDFRREALKSKAHWLFEQVTDLREHGHHLEPEVLAQVERVRALRQQLARMTDGVQSASSNDADLAARPYDHNGAAVVLMDDVLSAAFWAGEALVLSKARADLAARPVDALCQLRFGSALQLDIDARTAAYRRAYTDLFNFATLPFYRGRLQPKPESVDWSRHDATLDWLESHNIMAKGHPLVWPIKPSGLPRWMQKLNFTTLRDVMYRQIIETVSRFRDRVKVWDVINEAHDPVTLGAGHLPMTAEQAVELTAMACRAVREADPDAVRIVNCNKLEGYYRADDELGTSLHAIEYLEMLDAAGVEYDVLGLQMYQGATEHWIGDMTEQSALIDRYSVFGKPIHITEIQVPSSVKGHTNYIRLYPAEGGWWHRPWDLEVQADWVEQFYTIALSKPAVEAVTWWALSDRRTFWPSGGLLDNNDVPKPAYYRLKSLLDQIRQKDGQSGF